MYLTLNEAAKQAGKSKSTISKYLKEGKLSYVEKTDDGYKIDPAELFRVFDKSEHKEQSIEQSRTHDEHSKNKVLEKEIELLREQLKGKESENEKLWEKLDNAEKRIDKLTDTISQQTILLTDQRERPPQKPVESPKGFWATILGKTG